MSGDACGPLSAATGERKTPAGFGCGGTYTHGGLGRIGSCGTETSWSASDLGSALL